MRFGLWRATETMQNVDHRGYWWCPDDPKPFNFGGNMSFDPASGGILELMGRFGDADQRRSTEFQQFKLIHGYDPASGSFFTLHDCYETFIKPSLRDIPQYSLSTLRTSCIYKYLADQPFGDVADLVFDRLMVSFNHLNAWMSQLNWEHDGHQISYNPPDPITITCDDAEIVLRSEVSDFNPIPAEVSWKEHYFFVIVPKQALSISDFEHALVYPLRQFLTLATGIPCQPSRIIGLRSEPPERTQIFCAIPDHSDVRRRLITRDAFFSYPDVKSEFPEYLKSWLGFSQRIRLAFDLYFSLDYEGSMGQSTYFLFLTQALEIYHREMLDENEAKQKVQLKERILKICSSVEVHSSNILNFLFSCEETFAENVRITRNYFAHGSRKEGEEPVSGIALLDYIRVMRILFQVRLLTDMGFPTDLIDKLVGQSRQFKFASRRDRWSSPFF